jgi:hypothetical protein
MFTKPSCAQACFIVAVLMLISICTSDNSLAAAAANPTDQDLRNAAAVGPEVQINLPGETGETGHGSNSKPTPAKSQRYDQRSIPTGERHWRSESRGDSQIGVVGGISQILLYGVIVVGILVLLVTIVSEVAGSRKVIEDSVQSNDDATIAAQVSAVISKPLDDADALAAAGKFSEAIHTLLALTLYELAGQSSLRLTGAMTSREILAKVPLLGDARTALADLVTAVELTWFGDDVAGQVDYQRCRQQFSMFAAAYKKGATRKPGSGTSKASPPQGVAV